MGVVCCFVDFGDGGFGNHFLLADTPAVSGVASAPSLGSPDPAHPTYSFPHAPPEGPTAWRYGNRAMPLPGDHWLDSTNVWPHQQQLPSLAAYPFGRTPTQLQASSPARPWSSVQHANLQSSLARRQDFPAWQQNAHRKRSLTPELKTIKKRPSNTRFLDTSPQNRQKTSQ